MLNQAKTSLYVVTLIAIFFVISLVIGATSIGTVTLADQQPVNNSPDEVPVTEVREATVSQPAMGETLYEAGLIMRSRAQGRTPQWARHCVRLR